MPAHRFAARRLPARHALTAMLLDAAGGAQATNACFSHGYGGNAVVRLSENLLGLACAWKF